MPRRTAYSMTISGIINREFGPENHANAPSHRPEYSFLHEVHYADLDIWSLKDLPKLISTESDGPRKRVAWTMLEQTSTTLAQQQSQLDRITAEHQTALKAYQQSLGDIQAGLTKAKGNVQAETKALKEDLHGVVERHADLSKACQEMEALMASMREKSGEFAGYAEEWLKH